MVNISGMSFGARSGQRRRGAQPGSRACYFGLRDERGRFDLARLKDTVASAPVRVLEVKLSQGAKPGLADTCPTGVATQNRRLSHGLDPTLKSVRCANYVRTLRRDLLKLAEATGVEHPGLIARRRWRS